MDMNALGISNLAFLRCAATRVCKRGGGLSRKVAGDCLLFIPPVAMGKM